MICTKKLLAASAAAALASMSCGNDGSGTRAPASGSASGVATAAGSGAVATADGPGTELDIVARTVSDYRAWNEGKLEVALGSYHDDATWTSVGNPTPPREGKENILAAWKEMKAGFSDFEVVPRRLFHLGDELFVQLVARGTHDGKWGGKEATGTKVGTEILQHITFRDGKVASVANYWDPTALLKQIGAMPVSPADPAPPIPAWPDAPEVIAAAGNPEALVKVKAVYAGLSSGDMTAMKEGAADTLAVHDLSRGMVTEGVDKNIAEVEMMKKAIPDASWELENAAAIGDYAIALYLMKGTHKGDMGPLKATGKRLALHGADVIHFTGDKTDRIEFYANGLEFAVTLGLMPAPGAPPAE